MPFAGTKELPTALAVEHEPLAITAPLGQSLESAAADT